MEKKKDRNIEIAENIASAVAEAGGRTFYVGGFVRDRLMGIENKDVDIEVHGIPYKELERMLSRFGEQKVMGASFGIFGLKHCDLDIAMPRSEKANGRGHKDFEVYVDPFIGPEKAARRRDFTINAMMQDVLTGEILDFYGGQKDLEAGLIRHVNDVTFVEDPLRVLRAAQFAARFEFQIAEDTRKLCRKMDLSALSKERIMGELEKALLKAPKPSVFFEELQAVDQLNCWFPELAELPRCVGLTHSSPPRKQYEEWNICPADNDSEAAKESCWSRTMRTLDNAAVLRNQAKAPLWFVLSALCLNMEETDPRKPAYCVENNSVRYTEQENNGKKSDNEDSSDGGRRCAAAEQFLARLSTEVRQREYVLNMVLLHREPARLLHKNDSTGTNEIDFMRLYDASVCPEDLLLLCDAEVQAADTESDLTSQHLQQDNKILQDMLVLYRERMDAPGVMGRDLIAAGFKPGTEFKAALQYAHELQLAGIPKDQALQQTLIELQKVR